jgi:hypothetical protein
MPSRPDRVSISIGGGVMHREDGHGCRSPALVSILTSEFYFARAPSGAGDLPFSFGTIEAVAEEPRAGFMLVFPSDNGEATLKIRAGYDIAFNCVQEVPMLLLLSVHPSRQHDLLTEHVIRFSPDV